MADGLVNSSDFRGLRALARSNSVLAMSHVEKSLRFACSSSDSSGTVPMAATRLRRSSARATSAPLSSLNTKSPNPRCSRMNPRTSCSSLGEVLWQNAAPSFSAFFAIAASVD